MGGQDGSADEGDCPEALVPVFGSRSHMVERMDFYLHAGRYDTIRNN